MQFHAKRMPIRQADDSATSKTDELIYCLQSSEICFPTALVLLKSQGVTACLIGRRETGTPATMEQRRALYTDSLMITIPGRS